jgi:hypothetical protein
MEGRGKKKKKLGDFFFGNLFILIMSCVIAGKTGKNSTGVPEEKKVENEFFSFPETSLLLLLVCCYHLTLFIVIFIFVLGFFFFFALPL